MLKNFKQILYLCTTFEYLYIKFMFLIKLYINLMTIDHNHKKIYLYFQMSPPEWLLTWRVWPYRQCWQFLSPGQGPGRRQWPLPSHHSQWTVCNWRARYPVFKTNKRLSNHLHKERWNLLRVLEFLCQG